MSCVNSTNNYNVNNEVMELYLDCNNEVERIIELNKITLMLYGVELHKITFKNGDMTDLRNENVIFNTQ